MNDRYLMTCRTIEGWAGNDRISFSVTVEEAISLINLARGIFKKPVIIERPTVTVTAYQVGLNYYDSETPGAARGSMMDRNSVIEQADKVLAEAHGTEAADD